MNAVGAAAAADGRRRRRKEWAWAEEVARTDLSTMNGVGQRNGATFAKAFALCELARPQVRDQGGAKGAVPPPPEMKK